MHAHVYMHNQMRNHKDMRMLTYTHFLTRMYMALRNRNNKLIHTHMESSQHTYAGFAFDFSFNPGHQRVVVDQICRFTARQQGGDGMIRRSA